MTDKGILSSTVTILPPCHHPAWPRYCILCLKLVEGSQINKIQGENGFSIDVTYCRSCGLTLVEDRIEDHPLRPTLTEVFATLKESHLGQGTLLSEEEYQFCRTGPVKASTMLVIQHYMDRVHHGDYVLAAVTDAGKTVIYRNRNQHFMDMILFRLEEGSNTVTVFKRLDEVLDDSSV